MRCFRWQYLVSGCTGGTSTHGRNLDDFEPRESEILCAATVLKQRVTRVVITGCSPRAIKAPDFKVLRVLIAEQIGR